MLGFALPESTFGKLKTFTLIILTFVLIGFVVESQTNNLTASLFEDHSNTPTNVIDRYFEEELNQSAPIITPFGQSKDGQLFQVETQDTQTEKTYYLYTLNQNADGLWQISNIEKLRY